MQSQYGTQYRAMHIVHHAVKMATNYASYRLPDPLRVTGNKKQRSYVADDWRRFREQYALRKL